MDQREPPAHLKPLVDRQVDIQEELFRSLPALAVHGIQVMALVSVLVAQNADADQQAAFAGSTISRLIRAAHPEITDTQWGDSLALYRNLYATMLASVGHARGEESLH